MIVLRQEKPLKHPPGQPTESGAIILDKPPGPSSHEVTAWVAKILGVKAGHSGTLDPKVTGVLVIAYGKARKLLRALEKSDKEYVCLARFQPPVEQARLRKVFKQFTGEIEQMPPKEAAVTRKLRKRKIYGLELLETREKTVLFRVKCQHGTYIRVLVRDVARTLGVKGEMLELRRTRAEPFSEGDCVTMQELVDVKKASRPQDVTIPMGKIVAHLKKMVVGNNAVAAVAHGADLARPGVVALDEDIQQGEMIVLETVAGELVGLARALHGTEGITSLSKGVVADTLTIVIEPGLYPRHWKKQKH